MNKVIAIYQIWQKYLCDITACNFFKYMIMNHEFFLNISNIIINCNACNFNFQVPSDFRDPFPSRNGTRSVMRIGYRTPACKPKTSFSGTSVVPNNGIRTLPSVKTVFTSTFLLQLLSKRFETFWVKTFGNLPATALTL